MKRAESRLRNKPRESRAATAKRVFRSGVRLSSFGTHQRPELEESAFAHPADQQDLLGPPKASVRRPKFENEFCGRSADAGKLDEFFFCCGIQVELAGGADAPGIFIADPLRARREEKSANEYENGRTHLSGRLNFPLSYCSFSISERSCTSSNAFVSTGRARVEPSISPM